MLERETLKRDAIPLLAGLLTIASLFTYHWCQGNFKYTKNADRTIPDEETVLLREVYFRTRSYVELNQSIPDTLADLLSVAAPDGTNHLEQCSSSIKRSCQVKYYPEYVQFGDPDPAIILATEPDSNNTNKLRVLFYDGRVESLEKDEVTQRIRVLNNILQVKDTNKLKDPGTFIGVGLFLIVTSLL